MNSSPDTHSHYRPRLRRRTMSIENTNLTEVITIYEKLKKSRDHDISTTDVFRPSKIHFGVDLEDSDFEESVPLEPFFHSQNLLSQSQPPLPPFGQGQGEASFGPQSVLDFNKFRLMHSSKYLYFSGELGLLQATSLDELKSKTVLPSGNSVELNFVKLLKSKQYWLNIIDPSEQDLVLLGSAFNVHDLTLRDIREGNTEEKIEVYKHYMFISLRLLSESDNTSSKQHDHGAKYANGSGFINVADEKDHDMDKESDNHSLSSCEDEGDPMPVVEDVDFNILLFSDFIITIHDKHWSSIKDVLGFLHLLTTYGSSLLTPDWVLFSVFIELAQDAKHSVKFMEPHILSARLSKTINGIEGVGELSKVLRKNFEYEFEIYKITRFIKPKMTILKTLQIKCSKRLSPTVIKLLSNICREHDELLDELNHFSRILERSQDICLTLVSVHQSQEANEMSKVMKRISEAALIFLPVQAIGGFLGMNVKVPFQEDDSTMPFWGIVTMSFCIVLCVYLLRKVLLGRQYFKFRFRCR